MRNSFTYNNFDKLKLLNALLNISKDIKYISILISNIEAGASNLPKDYITHDIIAGVGSLDYLVSNENSLNKLSHFHSKNKDWLFGYISYDLKNELEKLTSHNKDNMRADNLFFFKPEFILLLKNNQLEIQSFSTKENCDKFIQSFNYLDIPYNRQKTNLQAREDKLSYINKINKIKEHIQMGDIYEMNYCQEFFSNDIKLDPESIFFELNSKMESPFSSFLKLDKKYIMSSSPERFLRKVSTQILSQPIKGTIRRGKYKNEDTILKHELTNSKKDIIENIMITDLVRNDLSIYAKNNSVKVDELCKVYSFKNIQQMISSISSEITSNTNFSKLLSVTFPMGSMTGAPKIRAMQLIELFEEFKRGIYSGSVGYITPAADFDFNVIIRTILYNNDNNYLSIGVGGAITINSDPNEEYKECIVKAKPIFEILNFKMNNE